MKIAIASGKGGTGKTTVAVNLYHLHGRPVIDDPLMIVAFDAWVDAGSAATRAASLLAEDGVVSGSYPIPNPYLSPNQLPLCQKCHDRLP